MLPQERRHVNMTSSARGCQGRDTGFITDVHSSIGLHKHAHDCHMPLGSSVVQRNTPITEFYAVQVGFGSDQQLNYRSVPVGRGMVQRGPASLCLQ